ncbi:MAG: DUF1580 domain-containing protein [Planctomycetaceae bacterium]
MPTTIATRYADAIPLTRAPDFIPGRPNISTCWRWATHGVRGVKLKTVIIGGRRFVTMQSLEDFLAALNVDTGAADESPADVKRRGQEACDALEKIGC